MSPDSKINIDLEIQELVLDGFTEQDGVNAAEALKGELSRLLSQGGIADNLKRNVIIERLDGGSFQIGSGISGGEIGKQAAQNLYGGIRQ